MSTSALLIANRGEISIRIARAAADLGIRTVAVYSRDDGDSLHTQIADEAVALAGTGAAAYLDVDAIIEAARENRCDAIHPGYGFLAERADFAIRCAEDGLTFVGPDARLLELAETPGVLSFPHALIREVTYQSLTHARRRELHSEVARAFE